MIERNPAQHIGALLAPGAMKATPAPTIEGQEFLTVFALASIYDTSPEKLLSELKGPGTLAAIGRDLLGLQMLAPPPSRRGRKPKDEANWSFFVLVELSRRQGKTWDAAFGDYLDFCDRSNAPPVGGNSIESVKTHHKRLRELWAQHEIPQSLAALYSTAPSKRKPAKQKGDKKKA